MSVTNHADCDRDTLLGLYHGYDQARLVLAKLVARYGSRKWCKETTQREFWARCHRAGFSPDLFYEGCEPPVKLEDVRRGAHVAALTAFATISDKAEELLQTLTSRWPALSEDVGGPLPTRLSNQAIHRVRGGSPRTHSQ